MDAERFDTLTRTIARRVSRRRAVATGGLGLTAALMSRLAPAVHAQGATPVGDATPAAGAGIEVLFVQTFGSAAVDPGPTSDTFTITLTEGTGQTVYFSDRPDRLAGTLPDAQFLDGRAFDPQDPPNAAIVTMAEEHQDILVVELRDPAIDTASGAVTYTAHVLQDQPEGDVIAGLAARQDDTTIGDVLGPTTLFIDQLTCAPENGPCNQNSDCCSDECCISATCDFGLCA